MNSSAICSLLFTLCLVLISHSPLEANARKVGGRVNFGVICNSASDKVGCSNILNSDPRIKAARNYLQLSKIVLEIALKKAIIGQNLLKGLALATRSPAIKQCATFDYDGVVGSFRSALGELTEDPQTANYDAKTAGDGSATCEIGLAKERVNNPQIAALNRQISLFSQVAFLVTNQLS